MGDEIRNGFIVNSDDFNRSVKLIKKAYPRKKKEQNYVAAVFNVVDNKASISMSGAEIYLKATCFGQFAAEIPFLLFKDICRNQYEKNSSIIFMFDYNFISVNGVACRHPGILFQPCGIDHASLSTGDLPKSTVLNSTGYDCDKDLFEARIPVDKFGSLGLPLLTMYYQLKKYPKGTLTRYRFMAAEAEIEKILTEVDKLLKPLGLGRHTIEKILDDRDPYNVP